MNRPLLQPVTPHSEAPLRPRQPIARRRKASLGARVVAALRVAAVLVAPMLATTWLATSPVFALREVTVAGGDRIEAHWVEAQLSDLKGRHVLAISLADVQGRLQRHPWLAEVSIRKQLPDQLTVELVESEPALLVRRGTGLWFVDAGGNTIAAWQADARRGDLPIVIWEGEDPVPAAEVEAFLAELAAARPEWAAAASEIELLGDGDVRLLTSALPWALIFRRGAVAAGIQRLELALPAVRRRAPRPAAFDVRFDRRIIVHPLTGSRASGA